MGVTVVPIVAGGLGTVPKSLEKGTRRIEDQKIRDHLDYSIVENDQNAEMVPGDLRRLAVT